MKNAFRNWKTTAVAFIIIVSSAAMLLGKIDGNMYIGILGVMVSAGFLVSKDADKTGVSKKPPTILLLLPLILLSCKPTQQITEKHFRSDSTIIEYEPIVIEIPGSQVIQELPANFYDSISQVLQQRPPDQRVIYQTDPTLQTRLSFFLDSLGRLQARCESLERQYEGQQKNILRIVKEIDQKLVTEEKKPGLFAQVKTTMNNMVWLIVIIGVAILYIKLK